MPILDPSQADDIADYLTAVTGAAQGYVYVGVGINPFRNAKDKIRFRAWQEFPFQWPDQADEVLAALLEFSGEHDCYLCPNVMATAERAKGNSAGAMEIHADVDGGLLNLPLVRSLPGAAPWPAAHRATDTPMCCWTGRSNTTTTTNCAGV